MSDEIKQDAFYESLAGLSEGVPVPDDDIVRNWERAISVLTKFSKLEWLDNESKEEAAQQARSMQFELDKIVKPMVECKKFQTIIGRAVEAKEKLGEVAEEKSRVISQLKFGE